MESPLKRGDSYTGRDPHRADLGDAAWPRIVSGVGVCGRPNPLGTAPLVKEGWGWWYQTYAPGDTVLEQLEVAAREGKRGLRQDAHPCRRGSEGKGPSEAANGGDATRFGGQGIVLRIKDSLFVGFPFYVWKFVG